MIARSITRQFQRKFFGHAGMGQHSGACMITSVAEILRDEARTVYRVSIAHPHPSQPFPNCNAGQCNKVVPTRPRRTMSQKHSSRRRYDASHPSLYHPIFHTRTIPSLVPFEQPRRPVLHLVGLIDKRLPPVGYLFFVVLVFFILLVLLVILVIFLILVIVLLFINRSRLSTFFDNRSCRYEIGNIDANGAGNG